MKILTAVASKHGSTYEIAQAVAEELRSAGHTVDLFDVKEAPSLKGYEAAVIGSAIYMGRWMAEAQAFVDGNHAQLAELPVWLFSSGPLGDEYPEGMGVPGNLDALMEATGAREHRVFVGQLDKGELGLAEKLIVRVVKAPEGDFRDWEAIRGWACEIAAAILTLIAVGAWFL